MNLWKEKGDVGRKWVGKQNVGCQLDKNGSEYSQMGSQVESTCNESLYIKTGRQCALRSNNVFVYFILFENTNRLLLKHIQTESLLKSNATYRSAQIDKTSWRQSYVNP
jgi:hypothetical protein